MAEDFLFRLDDTDGFSIHEKHVVAGAGVGAVFADGLTLAGVEVDGALVLNAPPRRPELGVDQIEGKLFGILVGHGVQGKKCCK